MPLHLVRSSSNADLWAACVGRVLDELDEHAGPDGYPSHLWLSHRTQRDLLLEAAGNRGLPGWLAPPFSFFSELPERFGIDARPIGLLTGRVLISRIAIETARRHGFGAVGGADAPGRGHMIDGALSELLPEGVTADELEQALARLPVDEFSTRRNAWLIDTYREYGDRVAASGRFDPRAIHAIVTRRIRAGGLSEALRGARRLHVFGLTSLRGRTRLFEALATQREVDVHAYLPADAADGEWERLAESRETPGRLHDRSRVIVQPAPDAIREARWVARSIKSLLVEGSIEPWKIAVIARSGREDTRLVHDALRRAGVPTTARLRSRLDQIPVLRAVLQLLEAVADEWSWTSLRAVLANPYWDIRIDRRAIDHLASRSRPVGLDQWIAGLELLETETRSDRRWILERAGVTGGLLQHHIRVLRGFADRIRPLAEARAESAWIDTTRRLFRGDPLDVRDTVCAPVGGRRDVVRLDQRGLLAVDDLLREWGELEAGSNRALDPYEWHTRLRRLLEANEIAISSPLARGVQVLEAHEAGATPFTHAFVVHANDGIFPQPRRGGLFTDEERERLAAGGLPVPTRDLALERERRLWAACTGSEQVRVSYRTADANGVPRLASLLVPDHDAATELPRTRREVPGDTTDARSLVTPSELLEHEVARFARERRSGRLDEFATPDPHAVRHAALNAFAEELRQGGLDEHARRVRAERTPDGTAAFGPDDAAAAVLFGNDRPLSERPHPWSGAIRDPVVLATVRARFGEGREWSASQLETYGRRPFDFLVERVLGLRESEGADDEASNLTIGALVHRVLERFYGGRPGVNAALEDDWRASLEAAFAATCRDFESTDERWVGLPHVWAATRDELAERLATFVAWERAQRGHGVPIAVELAFGAHTGHPAVDLGGPGRDGPERPLLLAGRIDRVDRLARGGGLRVIDYKSGGAGSAPGPRAFEDGAALQASIYMAAAEALGLGEPAIGVYWTVRDPGNRGARGPADIGPALRIAREIPIRVAKGLFEAAQARSTPVRDWQLGRDVTRSSAIVSSGTRFDPVSPMPLPGAPDPTGSRPDAGPREPPA